MVLEPYAEICRLLKDYSLELSIEEGIIFVQNGRETLGISQNNSDKNKLDIFYITLERRIADITLRGCPKIIKDWHDRLKTLRGYRGYEPVPYFKAVLDFKSALEACSYLASAMVSKNSEPTGERRSATNQQKEGKAHNLLN